MSAIRRLIPRAIKSRLRALHQRWALRRGLRRLAATGRADGRTLSDLHYGWGNTGWSAGTDLLGECIRRARAVDGHVLECGSGLTTVALGVLAGRYGFTVWSLEHLPEWSERVRREVIRTGADHVKVLTCPLRPYGDFDWYDVPDDLPDTFSLVVCDGPPGDTRGGRSGWWHVMGDRLAPDGVVLFDDMVRDEDRAFAESVASDLGREPNVVGDGAGAYMVLAP